MILAFKITLWAHIAAGAVALSVFWLPLVTKKGGRAHRRAGWVYVVAAGVIALTGLVNCVRMLTDGNPKNDAAGVFLAYIGVLAGANALLGVRALQTKRRTTATRSPLDVVPAGVLVAAGIGLGAFGLVARAPLDVIFAALGITLGASQLRFWLRAPKSRQQWFYAHMGGMGGSCITTVTAFLVVNAHRFGLGTFDLVVWVAPGVIGGLGLSLWRRYYEKRFAAALEANKEAQRTPAEREGRGPGGATNAAPCTRKLPVVFAPEVEKKPPSVASGPA